MTDYSVGQTIYLATPHGWHNHTVTEWRVGKVTPSGQVVCERGDQKLRLTKTGRIIGDGEWSGRLIVSREVAQEMVAQKKVDDLWRKVAAQIELLEQAVRSKEVASLNTVIADLQKLSDAIQEQPA